MNAKKAISFFLAFMMLFGAAALGFTAFANSDINYNYTISGNEAIIKSIGNLSGDITLPSSYYGYPVTAIDQNVFARNTGITSVVISENIRSIGNNAFDSCTSLEKFTVASGNEYFTADESGVLFNKDKTEIAVYPAGNKRTEYVIPDGVKGIARYAFAGSIHLEEVIWDDPGLEVGLGAFSRCTGLLRVTIPEGTKGVGDWAFNACYSLSEVNLPDSMESISCGAFHWCVSLEEIELPPGLKVIADNAFNECYRLKRINLPDGLERIYPKAFEKCFELEKIIIPDTVEYIGNTAFHQCFSLDNFYIPDSITTLESYVLRLCYSLKNIRIPDSVQAVNDYAFMDCRALESITVPENVSSMTGKAFASCTNLESIVVDENNKYFNANRNGVLFNEDGTKLVYFPAGKQDKVYTVPENVTSIGTYAFCDAQNLASVVIPASVTSIQAGAFCGNNMRDIYFAGTQEQWNALDVAKDTENPVEATVHFGYKSGDHVHEYEQEFTDLPDCTANGTKAYTCSCGESTEISYHYADTRVLCDGVNTEWIINDDSTCSACGTMDYHCNVCGYEWHSSLAKLEHDMDITVSDSAVKYECADCGHSFTEQIPDGSGYVHYKGASRERVHVYEQGERIITPPTPEKDGFNFLGWKDEGGNFVELGTMPEGNMVLTACFVKVESEGKFGVTATYEEGCFDEDVTMSVTEIEGDSRSGSILIQSSASYRQVKLFDIKMLNGDSEVVQPNSGNKVTIRFPIPEGLSDRDEFVITHWFTSGGRERLFTEDGGAKIEGGYIIIQVDKFSEFEIHVKSAATVSKNPAKTSYNYKQELDLDGIELTIAKPDGSVEKVTDTSKIRVTDYDSKKIGEQTVTVEYEGETATFTVSVSYAWWQWIIRILLLGFLWY